MWIVCLRFTILTRMLQSRSDLTPKPLLGDKSGSGPLSNRIRPSHNLALIRPRSCAVSDREIQQESTDWSRES